jgi:glutamyl-tRNA reductase
MKLVLQNITHHHCPVEMREKVSFTEEQRRLMLKKMRAEKSISEALILETCNRIEFYVYAKSHFDCDGFLAKLIRQMQPNAVEVWCKYRQQKEGMEVVRHLFEVAAGLDSQMIGESQILSQVKTAYTTAVECRTSKFIFNRLFHSAFRAGKMVRTNTNINCGAVSVGLAAVELAKNKIDLSKAAAMIIGAGENAELVAKCLLEAGLSKLIIANRNKQTAEIMRAGLKKGRAISLAGVTKKLNETDLLISSTAATTPVVTYKNVKDTLSKRKKPLLIIDIAVPRDIDSKIGKFKCVSLYNIDDLDEQISRNKKKRLNEIPKARAIAAEFAENFSKWYNSLDLVPIISRMTQKGIELAHRETERYAKDFGSENTEKLKLFAESLIKKILHSHINFLKNNNGEDSSEEQLQAADLINRIFFPQDKRS